jgi:hypothetical protein
MSIVEAGKSIVSFMKKAFLLTLLSSCVFFTAHSQVIKAVSVNLFGYITENNNERSLRDGIAVLLNGQSDAVDLYDAKKMTNPAENIAILRNIVLLAAEQRTGYDSIPITLWNLQIRNYELEIFTKNIDTLFLEDAVTHNRVYLGTAEDTIRYAFTSTIANTPQDSAVRFWLIFDTLPAITQPLPPVHHCGNHPRQPKSGDRRALKLYPNPATSGYINLEMKNISKGVCKLTFFAGNYVSSYSFVHGNDCTERINISQLPKGKYYFIIEDQEGWKETRQVEID